MSSKKNVSVLGAGKMGLGIAQLFATKGYNVKVIYVYDDKTRYDARAVVEDNLRVLAANDALDEAQIPEILGRIGFVDTIEEVADFADIVFECIVEKLEVKQEYFAKMDSIFPVALSLPAIHPLCLLQRSLKNQYIKRESLEHITGIQRT